MKARPRGIAYVPVGPPRPVKSLKFGVITREGLALSGIWTVSPHSNRRKPDVFVTATGLQGVSKFSFHKNILNHSWLSEEHHRLVDEGVVAAGSRHWQQIEIGPLPWHGLTVRFVDGMLRKSGQSLDHIDGDIIALEPPSEGQVLDVGFILAEGLGLEVKQAQFGIGEIGGGGRALVVVGRYSSQDTQAQKELYKKHFTKIGLPVHVQNRLEPKDDLAALLFGEESGAMIVTEVHNLKYDPPK